METPIHHYPIAVFEDRYQGTYSQGRWLAVSQADTPVGRVNRAGWLLDNGPFGDDVEAMEFWCAPPAWIAVGDTPEQAIAHLWERSKPNAGAA